MVETLFARHGVTVEFHGQGGERSAEAAPLRETHHR